ncbi:MAG: BREX-1 system adenine-specific DNA-methyltransferase PglX [Candidatus Thiodiazotropha taylori]|nr:BREX-1 system adenine-specific DNA-methyltransferase PglX [Candidatus Thiodiazotropha taylori]
METSKLKKFAQFARRSLIEQVSNKLKLVLAKDSVARRESAEAVKKLEEQIKAHNKEQVIEKVAYIWFNRFCALRFMDVNRYTRIGVVSPAEGQFQPEILAEAKMGHIDEDMVQDQARQQIFALLDGKAPSSDPQGEAYRLLVVAACNFWNKTMPFLFQRIEDYTELLMPDDLLSGNSILAYTREAMTPDTCEDVEVIGWLYQFYISEKKDEVFDGLKKNKKITPENIPAATQLFTPHWIVRYLVENSLGRLWLLNRPGSKLVGQMDYYIKPEQAETDFLRISKPEEIKICDPACGSGHMLTYAFDLLYGIYEEEGYEPAEIPEKILTHNLYGIEIDERAGELAAFALTMKACARQRRFFKKGVKPNVCVLESVHLDESELSDYMDFIGCDLFTAPLQTTLRQFEEAENYGSLILPDVTDVDGMLRILESKNVSGHLFLSMTHQKVLQALQQADYLSPKYHVVIANPPYMGSKGMNSSLAAWMKKFYPASKSDLMTAFMERTSVMVLREGIWGMINLPSWMFISTYKHLRHKLIKTSSINSMLHLGRGIFGSDFGTVAFTVTNKTPNQHTKATYRRLFERHVQVRSPKKIDKLFLDSQYNKFIFKQFDFIKIPGSPIAYWVSQSLKDVFENRPSLSNYFFSDGANKTGDNEKYLRLFWEVDRSQIQTETSHKERWLFCAKGGEFRRWYGNIIHLIDWSSNSREHYSKDKIARLLNRKYWYLEGITWGRITSGENIGFRFLPSTSTFETAGTSVFRLSESASVEGMLSLLSSKAARMIFKILNPTLVLQVGDVGNCPVVNISNEVEDNGTKLISLSKQDWDSYETSWDFTSLPLLNLDYRQPTLKSTYQNIRDHWQEMTLKMRRLEEENNHIFIEAYGLKDELTPEVPLNEITLTCNPHYRYRGDRREGELEALLMADTMRELVSYAVGCMFGRYALDKPGLILANQDETIEHYLKQIPESSFPADDDNVIPMLDGDWFTDDIAERFRKFLRVAFGEAHYEENLQFVEQALNIKGKRNYSIRDYFLGEFYTDHVKRYKKRPIYWLFSSSKGSFNALIYMHRYRPDTVSVVLNDYLREFRTKLTARKNHLEAVSVSASASQGEKTKALKEIDKLNRMIQEMEEYERDVLYPLAIKQEEIDLDGGVKVNYNKFGLALKKITGLSGK